MNKENNEVIVKKIIFMQKGRETFELTQNTQLPLKKWRIYRRTVYTAYSIDHVRIRIEM